MPSTGVEYLLYLRVLHPSTPGKLQPDPGRPGRQRNKKTARRLPSGIG